MLIAAQAFQVEEHARRRAERTADAEKAAREKDELLAAQAVTIEAAIGSWSDDVINDVRVTVRNASNETPIYQVNLNVEKIDRSFEVHRIEAGEWQGFVHETHFGSGFAPIVVSETERPDWVWAVIDSSTVTFEMNDRRWSRTGTEPAVRVR